MHCSVASAGALAGAADGDGTKQNLSEARLQVKTTEVLATQLMNIKLAQLEQAPKPWLQINCLKVNYCNENLIIFIHEFRLISVIQITETGPLEWPLSLVLFLSPSLWPKRAISHSLVGCQDGRQWRFSSPQSQHSDSHFERATRPLLGDNHKRQCWGSQLNWD